MKKIISTDSIGFLGSPQQFLYLYQDYFENNTFDGVEMIAFKPLRRLKNFMDILKKHNIKILSFHGKTGGENRLPQKYGFVITIVNAFILNVETLIKDFNDIDFLSHTPYFKEKKVKEFIIKTKPKIIWIENHNYGEGGIEETIREIENYRHQKVNAWGMLDLYHFLAKMPTKKIIDDWEKIIKKIENYSQWFSGVHFPIGSRVDDSLPIDQMTDEMLLLFGKKIVPLLKRLVIENQQTGIGLFGSTKKMLEKQKKRNTIIFSRLKKARIL